MKLDLARKAKNRILFFRKWGERYGLTLSQVLTLMDLWHLYKIQSEHVCNGDMHPNFKKKSKGKHIPSNPSKDECAAAWEKDVDITMQKMGEKAKEYGFEGIDFRVGLWPALIKDGESGIMLPSRDATV